MKKQMKLFTNMTKPFVLFLLLFAFGVGEMWGTSRTFKRGDRIFLKDAKYNGETMKVSGNNLHAVFCKGDAKYWVACSLLTSTWDVEGAIYYFDVPNDTPEEEYDFVIFSRNEWGRQTVDLYPDETYNIFYVGGWSDSKYTGSWGKYSINPILLGSMNNWDPDASEYRFGDYSSSVCRLVVDLPASTTYNFKILHGDAWFSYDNNKTGWTITNTTHESWQTLYNNNDDSHITTGEAGTYIFRYNDSDHTFAAYYPQARFTKQTILYFDVTDNTDWNNKTYTSKWYFKYWDSGSDIDAEHPEVCNTPVENYKYYVTIPNNDWLGRVQVDRYDGSRQGGSDVAMAYNRSASTQNCIKIGSGTSTSVTWDTYCPPTTSETFADNSTTKISWQPNTNDGSTSGKAIWVKTGTTLKVTANASKAVADPNMTIKYDFDVNSGSTTTQTTGAYTATASTNNTQYAVNAKMYTNYNLDNTASSTKHTHTIYYKALDTYSVTHTLSGVTKASGREGDDAAAYHVAYDATYTANAGYYLPSDITVTIGGATKTKGTDYTWTVTDGTSGALAILTDKIDGNVVVTINGVWRWSVAGSWTIITPGEGDPYWDPDTYAMGTITKVSSDDVCSVEVTLSANTNYTFKIADRAANPYEYWGNNTTTYYISYTTEGLPWTFGNDASNTAACGLTTAGAGTYTFTYNITQHKVSVTYPTSYYVTAAGNPAAGGTVTPSSATYMSTSVGGEITATPNYAYYFNGWTSNAGGSFTNASAATTTFKPASAAATVTAAFPERTAFIEGNFQIYNSTRATRTKTGNSWQDASTAIKMTYDSENNRYYLHTYSTPAELAEQLNSADAYFYVKTSTSSSSIANDATYKACNGAAQSLSEYGSSHSLLVTTGESQHGFKFTGSEDGYVIIYFNGTHVWYELECALSYYGGDGATGDDPASRTYYAYGSNQTAASNTYSKTGYTFDHWDTASDDGGTDYAPNDDVAMNAREVCLHAQWTAKEYTINLANMEADEGYEGTTSVTVTFDASTNMTASDPITKPTKTHYDFGGYWTSDDLGAHLGVKLIDENGNWIADVEGYTSHDGDNPTWVHDFAISLYAKWTEHEYAVTLAISPAGAGTTSPASSTTAKYVTASGDITATPSTGYLFREWGFSETGTGNYDVYVSDGSSYKSTDATIRIKAQRDGTLTANFTAKTYTVRFENLGADAGHKGSLDTTVTFNDTINMKGRIEVPSKSHYDFGGYYISTNKGATLTNIQIIDANGNWKKGISGYTGTKDGVASWVCAGDTVLYAKWSEDTHTVSVAVSPAGAGSVQVNSSNVSSVTGVGIATKSDEMTPIALAGWKFKEWQVTSNVQMDLVNYHRDYQQGTANKMKINATADDQTITAVFEPRFSLVGSEYGSSNTKGMPGWEDYTKTFTVNSSDPVNLTCSRTLEASTTYKFQIHDCAESKNLGAGTDGQYVLLENASAVMANQDKDVKFTSTGAGTYIFHITAIDGSYHPTVEILWPHQTNFGRRRVDIDGTAHDDNTGGTLVVKAGESTISTGSWHTYGTNIAYDADNQTGYQLAWYNSSSYSETFSAGGEWNHDLTSNDNCYAQFSELATKVSLENDGHGKVQIGSVDKTETTCGITTSRTITAVPNTGYSFSGWTKPSGDDLNFTADATNPKTFTSKGGGLQSGQRIYANFSAKTYSVKLNNDHGGASSDDGSATATYDATSLSSITDAQFSGWTLLGYWNSSAVQVVNANGSLCANVDGYTDSNGKWTNDAGETVNLYAHWSRSITLDDNGGSADGAATVTYNSTAGTPTITTIPTRSGYSIEGYYTNAACTTKVMEPTGKLVKSVSGYTDSNGKWTKTDDATLYTKWIFVIYRTGDKADDPRKQTTDVESYDGGAISAEIEFRMKVRELDKWYTLCLPFTVSAVKVWEEADCAYYDLVPFYRPTVGGTFYTGDYIIRTPKTATDLSIEEFGDWRDPTSPTGYLPSKNTPYIIQWHDSYFAEEGGRYISFFGATGQTITTFSAGDAPSSDNVVNVYGNNSMQSGSVAGVYLLENDYGSNGAWLRLEDASTARTILPFECYIRANTPTTTKYRVLRRDMTIDDTPTGWEDVLNSERKAQITVYTISGFRVAQFGDCSFNEAATRLRTEHGEGIYILRADNESVKLMVGGK